MTVLSYCAKPTGKYKSHLIVWNRHARSVAKSPKMLVSDNTVVGKNIRVQEEHSLSIETTEEPVRSYLSSTAPAVSCYVKNTNLFGQRQTSSNIFADYKRRTCNVTSLSRQQYHFLIPLLSYGILLSTTFFRVHRVNYILCFFFLLFIFFISK